MAYTTNTQLLEAIERLERALNAQAALIVELHGWATRFLAPHPTDPRKPPANPNGLTPGPTVETPIGPGIVGAGNRPQRIDVTAGQMIEIRFTLTKPYYAIDGMHSPEAGPSGSGMVKGKLLAPNGIVLAETELDSHAFRMQGKGPQGNYRFQATPDFSGAWYVKIDS